MGISSDRSRTRALRESSVLIALPILLAIGGCSGENLRWVSVPVDVEELSGEELFATSCSTCHGENGEGKVELFSPSIAGLPWWYVENQMKQFRDGHRGVHPEDIPGQQMRAVSLSLTNEQISEVAELIEAMDAFPTPAPPEGVDLQSARYHYANECMECHRYNGTGDRVFQSAPLVTLNRAYLVRQMKNYRDGLRGAVPGDLYGVKMVQVCKTMSDEAIEAMVDYLGALAHGDDPRVAWER